MIERILYDLIRAGIDARVADARITRRDLRMRGIETDEARTVAAAFIEKAPSLQHQYPREDSKFPGYFITLGRRRQMTKMLGDNSMALTHQEAESLGDLTFIGAEVTASFDASNFSIWTIFPNDPDFAVYYHAILEDILRKAHRTMKTLGLIDASFESSDVAPSESYLPHFLFIRRLDFSCQQEVSTLGDAPGGPVHRVHAYVEDVPELGEIHPSVPNEAE
mgnify:CR=1 FL=1